MELHFVEHAVDIEVFVVAGYLVTGFAVELIGVCQELQDAVELDCGVELSDSKLMMDVVLLSVGE